MMIEGEPRQGTGQVRDYVFCVECENRFRQNGETWVLANIPHDYGEPFPLHRSLDSVVPTVVEAGSLITFPGNTTPGFDIDKLIFFAASIFWRGAAHRWPPVDGHAIPTVGLGHHEEGFRRFLLGKDSFPADVWLTVVVYPYKKVPTGTIFPNSVPLLGWKKHWFYISGLGFVLDSGDQVPVDIRSRSTSHSPEQAITISLQFGDVVWNRIKELAGDFSGLESMLEEIAAIRSKKPPTT
jgi:hypothetical protein